MMRTYFNLQVGKKYKIQRATGCIALHKEWTGTIKNKTVHSEFATSYFFVTDNNVGMYIWDRPEYSAGTRIHSAELLK